MDPAAAAALTEQAYKLGGIAGVLLLILVAGGWLMFRFFVGMVKDLGARLDNVQGAQADKLTTCVDANTASNHAVVAHLKDHKEMSAQIVTALHMRPCLIKDEDQQAVTVKQTYKPIKTPLPRSYQ